MTDSDSDGEFTYWVEDEVLARFKESTPLQRLRWLEDMRRFSWACATDETRARWRRARERGRNHQ
jgi:hypothetical protein